MIERIKAWLQSDRSDTEEAVDICRGIPAAKTFISYIRCYSPDTVVRKCTAFMKAYAQGAVVDTPAKPAGSSMVITGGNAATNAGNREPSSTEPVMHITADSLPADKRRPNHFDQWMHLMPEDLREKVETIKANFDAMHDYRRELEELISSGNYSESEVARLSKLVVNYEARNLNIFAQADVCWDELVGRKVSDELKKQLAQEERKLMKTQAQPPQPPRGSNNADSTSASTSATPHPSYSPSGVGGAAPSVDCGSSLSDEQLSAMPIADLMALSSEVLPDGPRRYWLKRRSDQAQKYLRDKLPDTPSDAQREKARQYALDIIAINGKLSKKVAEKLNTLGIVTD